MENQNGIQKPKFKEGDKITYIDKNLLPNKQYFFGGENLNGYIGTVLRITFYNKENSCYEIEVSNYDNDLYGYSMLECEFEEYHIIKKLNPFIIMLIKRKKFKLKYNTTKWKLKELK